LAKRHPYLNQTLTN